MNWTFYFDENLELHGTIPFLIGAGWPIAECEPALQEAVSKLIAACELITIPPNVIMGSQPIHQILAW